MKNILYIPLIFLLFACTNEYVMQANLIEVYDHDFARYNYHITKEGINVDSLANAFNERRLLLNYVSVNESNDTIFIPSDSKYNTLAINLESNNSVKISSFEIYECKINCASFRSHHYIPGDTIGFHLEFTMESANDLGRKWLQETPTKELLSKLHISMSPPIKSKVTNKIPSVFFNNDTTKATIIPTVIINLEKNTVIKIINGVSITESPILPKSKDCFVN